MRGDWALRWAALAVLCMGVAGCRHRVAPATLPPAVQGPVPLERTPEPSTPPLVQTVPLQPAPLPAVTVPVKKVRKPRKKVPLPAVAAGTTAPTTDGTAAGAPLPEPSQSAAAVPQASVVGALTAGGETTTENHQKAGELIAGVEKRLAALSPAVADKQKEAVARVKLFERQAQAALNSGDADGAVTLATKANLLLDDLEKQ